MTGDGARKTDMLIKKANNRICHKLQQKCWVIFNICRLFAEKDREIRANLNKRMFAQQKYVFARIGWHPGTSFKEIKEFRNILSGGFYRQILEEIVVLFLKEQKGQCVILSSKRFSSLDEDRFHLFEHYNKF